jgi:hypothetical protein
MESLAPATLWPTFVLLFAVTPDAAAGRGGKVSDVEPIPDDVAAAHRDRIEGLQQRLLGEPYLQARRLVRTSVGRLPLPGGDFEPAFADIHLVVHKSGAAVWEVWLAAPPQAMDVVRWAGWLDMEATDRLESLRGSVLDAVRSDPHLIGHRDIYATGPPAMLPVRSTTWVWSHLASTSIHLACERPHQKPDQEQNHEQD